LLDAFEILQKQEPLLHLHIAGSGSGSEANRLRQRMEAMDSCVTLHGNLDQDALARLMGKGAITVLPSFYEGVPLVLAEAAACGCKIVATGLPGVLEQLAPVLGNILHLIPMPRLAGIDKPEPDDLPEFLENLVLGLKTAWQSNESDNCDLKILTWQNVFQRIVSIWKQQFTAYL